MHTEKREDLPFFNLVTILYVRNLTTATTEEDLMHIFSLNDTVQVDKVKKLRDFAFIHYAIREDAERALFQLNNAAIDDSVIEVTWAKPVDRANRRRSRLADQSNKELNTNVSSLNDQFPSVESLASSFSNMMSPVGLNLNPGLVQKSPSLRYLRSPTSISPCTRNRTFPNLLSSIGSERSPKYRAPSNPIQMLQDICHKNLWGDPIFLMYTFGNNSEDQKLHICKVIIPALCKQEQYFSTDKLCQLPEEAKLIAAEHTLKELGLCLNVNGPQTFVPPPSVPLDHGQGDVGNIFLSQSCTGNPSGLALSHASFIKPHSDSSRLFDLQ